jgi:hypothetical protein
MNVQLLTLGGVFAVLAMIPWIHIGKGGGKDDGWFPRLTSWLLALSAAAFTLAIPQWRDALAAATSGSSGVGKLTVVVIATGLCFWFQAVHRRKDPKQPKPDKNGVVKAAKVRPHHRRHHYSRLWTMVVSAAFGSAAVLAWVRSKEIIHTITKSPATYQTALGQFGQEVHNGTAAKALTPAQEHHYLWIGAVIFVVGGLLLRGFERKRKGLPFLFPPKKKKASGGGGQRAVPGGGGGPRQIEG